MPDPQPFASNSAEHFRHDDPPASAPASTPRTRRFRLHQALQATADIMQETAAAIDAPEQLGFRRRRRQPSPDPDPRNSSPSTNLDADDLRRRRSHKRRRLDSELCTFPEAPIKYGHYGQVEAGRLKLQIVSCDGGEHRDSRHPATYLGSQNLLRHDKSVYCSERSRINIVLRHADDTSFCLEKLHIVGPEHGFTAPVRMGVAYVAMSMNDLRKHMAPLPKVRPCVHPRNAPERLSLSEALQDPELGLALNRSDDLRWASETTNAATRNQHNSPGPLDANCEHPAPGDLVGDHSVGPAADAPFTLLSDEEPGPEDSSSQDVIDFRLQRLQRMRRRVDMDSWDRNRDDNWGWGANADDNSVARNSEYLLRMGAMMRPSLIGADGSSASSPPSDNAELLQNASDPLLPYRLDNPPYEGFVDSPSNDPHVVHARFSIEKEKHKVAIKFNPPVSGRFILLKMTSNRGNVDVQSIIAKGYGGSRFFPALEFR